MSSDDDAGAAHRAWLDQVREEAIDPDLPICDPHHHLWLDTGHTGWPYPLDALHADTGSGHNVVRTVFLECGAEYRSDGPDHLKPVGETEFVADLAEQSAASDGAEIAAIMGSADLLAGDAVEEVLTAHEEAGRGRFRGVRYVTANDPHPPLAMGTPAGVMVDEHYRDGVRRVGDLGYTYDAFCYHPQMPELIEVAKAAPDVTIVVDHLSGPLGVGPYKGRRGEILAWWRTQIAELATCPNVSLKLGGIGMPMFGLRWDRQDKPPTSDELAAPWADEIRYCIEQFGPDRCMFESNFPVDKRGASYVVLWNAFKKIAQDYSPSEKTDLFHDAAARAYRIETIAAS